MTILAKFSEVPVGREVRWQDEVWRKLPLSDSDEVLVLFHKLKRNRIAKPNPDTEVEVIAPV